MVRLAIVGSGPLAAVHVRHIEDLEDFEVAGIVAVESTALATPDVEVSHHDYEALYEETSPDGIVLSLPPGHRRAPAVAATTRGLPVLLPGAIAGTLSDAEAIVAATEAADSIALCGYSTAFTPVYETAVSRATAGEIGRVGNVRTRRESSADDGDLFERTGHDVEFLRRVAGDVEHVFARHTALDSGEAVIATLRFENDAVGHLDVRSRETDGQQVRRFELAGVDGLLEYDSDETAPFTERRGEAGTTSAPLSRDAHARQLVHFRDCIERTADPRVTPGDALATHRVCQAIRESVDRGARVSPSEVGA